MRGAALLGMRGSGIALPAFLLITMSNIMIIY